MSKGSSLGSWHGPCCSALLWALVPQVCFRLDESCLTLEPPRPWLERSRGDGTAEGGFLQQVPRGVEGMRRMSVMKHPFSPCFAYPIISLSPKRLWEEQALFCFCFCLPTTTRFV